MKDEGKYWKEKYEDLKIAIDLSADYMTVANDKGVFMEVSERSEEVMGIRKEDIIGKSCFDLEKDGTFNISSTAEVIRKKQKVEFIQTTRTNRIILITGYPIFNEKKEITKIINVSKDITNKRDLERALRETKIKLKWFEDERRGRTYMEDNPLSAQSKNMNGIKSLIEYFANNDALILLLGNTGTGKNYLANYIHNISHRSESPFITINCGAIPHNLLESELFGYEKGSFTGALSTGKAGLFELAGKGTIFLDEIGELPLDLQVKLLSVLDEKKFRPIGGNKDINLEARILAATNKDLIKSVNQGKFREDLYYRINIFPIEIPDLNERIEDIPELIDIFLKNYNNKYKVNKTISSSGYEELLLYKYPGNIRELKNIIERLVIISQKDKIDSYDVKRVIRLGHVSDKKESTISEKEPVEIIPLRQGIEEYEKRLLQAVIKKYRTTREQAKVLCVDQSTIVRKRQKYSL